MKPGPKNSEAGGLDAGDGIWQQGVVAEKEIATVARALATILGGDKFGNREKPCGPEEK